MSKKNSEFRFHVNYDYTACIPCIKKRCHSFMIPLLIQYYDHGPIFEEYECYSCRAKKKVRMFKPGSKRK